jgi:hypothetical protein
LILQRLIIGRSAACLLLCASQADHDQLAEDKCQTKQWSATEQIAAEGRHVSFILE